MICIICHRQTSYITPCGLDECKRHCIECYKNGPCEDIDTPKQRRAERDEKILKLRNAGKTYLDIALALDISIATVNGTMSRYGITQPRAATIAKTVERNTEIRRLAGSMMQQEIALKYNLSAVRVSQIIKAPRN
jgi:hypothetical protein